MFTRAGVLMCPGLVCWWCVRTCCGEQLIGAATGPRPTGRGLMGARCGGESLPSYYCDVLFTLAALAAFRGLETSNDTTATPGQAPPVMKTEAF